MESEDESNMEELDLPTDFKDLPDRINWNSGLPANISIPRVDLHSLVLDFAAVSFLDISAMKGLKTVSFTTQRSKWSSFSSRLHHLESLSLQVLKEMIRVEVEVYIVACDRKYLQIHHYQQNHCWCHLNMISSNQFLLHCHRLFIAINCLLKAFQRLFTHIMVLQLHNDSQVVLKTVRIVVRFILSAIS